VTTDATALTTKRQAAERARPLVDVAFWGGAVPGNLDRLAGLHAAGVVGIKAYLSDSGHPDFPPLDAAGLAAVLARTAALGTVLAVHAEDAALLRRGPRHTGPRYRDFLAARPPGIEVRAVETVIEAVRRTGGRVHVVHVASGAAADVVARARAEGLPVTAETCPHYLAPPPDGVPDGATRFACCPPVRGPEDADRLWDRLRDGTIGLVVSDHSPLLPAGAPEPADFSAAPGGIVGLQLVLPVTWTAARSRGIGLAAVARWMSAGPAALAGLAGKGEIAPGRDADLCLLAPDESFTVDPARLRHRRAVTPYTDRELAGVVREVWLRGEPVDPAGPGRGRLLPRHGSEGSPA
jgi:allantoinase